jgi:hypothetical protein
MDTSLIQIAEFAARCAQDIVLPGAVGPFGTDAESFRAAYAILRDEEAAGEIADALIAEKVDRLTVERLPERSMHGEYRFCNGTWFMWVSEGSGGFWWPQSPFRSNAPYFRQEAKYKVDRRSEVTT